MLQLCLFQYGTFDVTKKRVRQKFATTTQQSNQSVNAIKTKTFATQNLQKTPHVLQKTRGDIFTKPLLSLGKT